MDVGDAGKGGEEQAPAEAPEAAVRALEALRDRPGTFRRRALAGCQAGEAAAQRAEADRLGALRRSAALRAAGLAANAHVLLPDLSLVLAECHLTRALGLRRPRDKAAALEAAHEAAAEALALRPDVWSQDLVQDILRMRNALDARWHVKKKLWKDLAPLFDAREEVAEPPPGPGRPAGGAPAAQAAGPGPGWLAAGAGLLLLLLAALAGRGRRGARAGTERARLARRIRKRAKAK